MKKPKTAEYFVYDVWLWVQKSNISYHKECLDCERPKCAAPGCEVRPTRKVRTHGVVDGKWYCDRKECQAWAKQCQREKDKKAECAICGAVATRKPRAEDLIEGKWYCERYFFVRYLAQKHR